MDSLKKAGEKSELLAGMKAHGLGILRHARVILVTAFEEQLAQHFGKEIAALKEKIGSGRIEWKNLTDWVKADLTRAGWICYADLPGGKAIVFLEPIGMIHGETLCGYTDAWRTILALIAKP